MALGVGGVAAPGVDGFTAPGVDAFRGAWRRAVLRFVCVALSVRAHRPAAARPRAPAVLWGCFFRGRRTQLQSLQTRCHRAMRTSELPHTQDHCFKQHRALGTLPKNELLAGPLVPLSCYGAHRCRADRLAGAGPRRPRGRQTPSRATRGRNRGPRAAPTHRLVYADETTGGTASYAGRVPLSTSAGRASRSALLDGRAAERPRTRGGRTPGARRAARGPRGTGPPRAPRAARAASLPQCPGAQRGIPRSACARGRGPCFFLGARGAARRCRCPASSREDEGARGGALVSGHPGSSNLEPSRRASRTEPGGGARGRD